MAVALICNSITAFTYLIEVNWMERETLGAQVAVAV